MIPHQWPDDIEYGNVVRYEHKLKLHDIELPDIDSRLEIFKVPASHRSFPGRGVRVTDDIPSGVDVFYYAGVYRLPEMGVENNYLFDMPSGFVMDALPIGNESRFVNDVYGTDLEPNLDAKWVDVKFCRGIKLQTAVLTTNRRIPAGEELLLSYKWPEDKWESLIQTPKKKARVIIDLVSDNVTILKEEPVSSNSNIEAIQKILRYLPADDDDDNVDPELWKAFISAGECVLAHADQRHLPINLQDVPDGYKRCNECKSILLLCDKNFRKDASKTSGYRGTCKKCQSGLVKRPLH